MNRIYAGLQRDFSWSGLPITIAEIEDWNVESIGKAIMKLENGIVKFVNSLLDDKLIDVIQYLIQYDSDRSYHILLDVSIHKSLEEFIAKIEQYTFRNFYFFLTITMNSKEFAKTNLSNLNLIRGEDEVKFVCDSSKELTMAAQIIEELNIANALIYSIADSFDTGVILGRILNEKIRARFQWRIEDEDM